MEQTKKKKGHYNQGHYKVKNIKKYAGDYQKCVYRSGWEKKVFKYFDNNKDVVKWCSEPFAIPYLSPKDNKIHRYFPDIIVATKTKNGIITTLIEIKPLIQTLPPIMTRNKKQERIILEQQTYDINQAKWEAARALCLKKKWKFKIMTEQHINPNNKPKR